MKCNSIKIIGKIIKKNHIIWLFYYEFVQFNMFWTELKTEIDIIFLTQVYLQLTKESAKAHKYRGWLCGGVVVDPNYVLTSAACVEDADRFYIVSGTTKFVDSFDYKNDECVCKHRRRVVWKCIPKSEFFIDI